MLTAAEEVHQMSYSTNSVAQYLEESVEECEPKKRKQDGVDDDDALISTVDNLVVDGVDGDRLPYHHHHPKQHRQHQDGDEVAEEEGIDEDDSHRHHHRDQESNNTNTAHADTTGGVLLPPAIKRKLGGGGGSRGGSVVPPLAAVATSVSPSLAGEEDDVEDISDEYDDGDFEDDEKEIDPEKDRSGNKNNSDDVVDDAIGDVEEVIELRVAATGEALALRLFTTIAQSEDGGTTLVLAVRNDIGDEAGDEDRGDHDGNQMFAVQKIRTRETAATSSDGGVDKRNKFGLSPTPSAASASTARRTSNDSDSSFHPHQLNPLKQPTEEEDVVADEDQEDSSDDDSSDDGASSSLASSVVLETGATQEKVRMLRRELAQIARHTSNTSSSSSSSGIVRYYGTATGEDHLYVVAELCCGGTLRDVLSGSNSGGGGGGLPELLVQAVAASVLRALVAAHDEVGVAHGAVDNLENILVTLPALPHQQQHHRHSQGPPSFFEVRLANFGSHLVNPSSNLGTSSGMLGGGGLLGTSSCSNQSQQSSSMFPSSSQPRRMTSSTTKRMARDVFALGCLVVELLTGKKKDSSSTDEKHHENDAGCPCSVYSTSSMPVPPKIPSFVSDGCRRFLELCFVASDYDRPPAHALLSQPATMNYSTTSSGATADAGSATGSSSCSWGAAPVAPSLERVCCGTANTSTSSSSSPGGAAAAAACGKILALAAKGRQKFAAMRDKKREALLASTRTTKNKKGGKKGGGKQGNKAPVGVVTASKLRSVAGATSPSAAGSSASPSMSPRHFGNRVTASVSPRAGAAGAILNPFAKPQQQQQQGVGSARSSNASSPQHGTPRGITVTQRRVVINASMS